MAKFKRCSVNLLCLGEKAEIKGDIALGNTNHRLYRLLLNHPSNRENLAHIYILSTDSHEPIDTGDWYYDTENNRVDQLRKAEVCMSYDRKIIATTNLAMDLPRLPKKFVDKFIKSFNEDKAIEFAMVEYFEDKIISDFNEYANNDLDNRIIKTDRNKFITIKRIKDNYSKAEVIELLNGSYDLGRQDYIASERNGAYINTLVDWIEENL